MPTEKRCSSTSSAPSQTTATRSRPNTSLCSTREHQVELLRRDVGVHRVDHEVEQARLPVGLAVEQLDRLHAAQRLEEVARAAWPRGRWPPRSRRAADGRRPSAAGAGTTSTGQQRHAGQRAAVDDHHRQRARRPARRRSAPRRSSSSASAGSCWTAPKRDTTSPVWRFSNQLTGSRSRWANTLPSHCRLSVVERCSTAHERIAAVRRPGSAPAGRSRGRA